MHEHSFIQGIVRNVENKENIRGIILGSSGMTLVNLRGIISHEFARICANF